MTHHRGQEEHLPSKSREACDDCIDVPIRTTRLDELGHCEKPQDVLNELQSVENSIPCCTGCLPSGDHTMSTLEPDVGVACDSQIAMFLLPYTGQALPAC